MKPMAIVAKILPIKYNNYFDWVRTNDVKTVSPVIELTDGAKIKDTIIELLFKNGKTMFDYLLVTFDSKIYIVERDGDSSYCKRDITYHPMMNLVKLSVG